jgi:GT2 family glycosyltransferase
LNARLAVLVVSYNTVDLLRRCLASLHLSLERSPVDATVVVVDNASSDGSMAMVEREFPHVRRIALPDNRGFAAGNNVALRSVSADYYLLLNPDTEVLSDAPSALVRHLEQRTDVGLCGGRLLNPDLSFQESCYRFPTLQMTFLDLFPINYRLTRSWLNGRYPRTWYNRPFEIDHPLGACMCVRGEVVQRVGEFDEGFFMYCEEVDLCLRIKQAGWKITYTPDALVIHHIGASSRQNPGAMLVQLHRSRDRFFQKHYGEPYTFAARQIVAVGMRAAMANADRRYAAGALSKDERDRQIDVFRRVVQW